LLGIRIAFKLLAANPATPIVGVIYNLTDSLVKPFSGIFPNISLGVSSTLDIVALVALLSYSFLFYLFAIFIKAALPGIYHEERISHEHT